METATSDDWIRFAGMEWGNAVKLYRERKQLMIHDVEGTLTPDDDDLAILREDAEVFLLIPSRDPTKALGLPICLKHLVNLKRSRLYSHNDHSSRAPAGVLPVSKSAR